MDKLNLAHYLGVTKRDYIYIYYVIPHSDNLRNAKMQDCNTASAQYTIGMNLISQFQ